MSKSARVIAADLVTIPNEDPGNPAIRVTTTLPAGTDNAFYIETHDKSGKPVDANDIKNGDEVTFNMLVFGLPPHTEAMWNSRTFRQRGYSFDYMDSEHNHQ